MVDTEYKIIRPAINPCRWNTQDREDGLYICRGLHDKNEVCDFEKMTADIWHHVTEVIRERDKVEQLYDQLLYMLLGKFIRVNRGTKQPFAILHKQRWLLLPLQRRITTAGIMCECTCGGCTDEDMADMKHGLSTREKLRRDPDYGDWVYEQERDKELEKEMDKEKKDD